MRAVAPEEGSTPGFCAQERHCPTCGTKVSKYNRPRAKVVYCYTCEDKMPWTYAGIVGSVEGLGKAERRAEAWTGRRRGRPAYAERWTDGS